MVRRWCVYLAVMLGCMILMIAYQGWLAWLLLVAVLATPLFSLAVSLPAMLTMALDADCSGKVPMGAHVTAQVKSCCLFPVPEHRFSLQVKRVPTGQSWVLKPGQTLPTEHCGQLLCVPHKCYVYDYLKLFRWRVRRCGNSSLVVEPLPVRMSQSAPARRKMPQGWRPKPGGGFAENHELRLFRPGDGMNQVHWKLTAKTGKLMVREAMEPLQRQIVLRLEIRGEPEVLDRKLGRLLWLGSDLLYRQLFFEIQALTANGVVSYNVCTEQELNMAIEQLLCAEPAEESQMLPASDASWSCHIGGGTDEA